MLGLEVVVLLGVAVLGCQALGPRLRVAPPILLLGVGVLAGFVPALRSVSLPPELMLLVFLPALLYWESLTTSLREIRANLRPVLLLSTVLVVATATTVAAVAHALGLPWGPAWVLGAALGPTDATAVAAVARGLPRRLSTVLRAESLVNDATALVVYGLAVGITVGELSPGPLEISGLLLLSYAGGLAAGLGAAFLVGRVRAGLDSPLQENVVSVLTPFLAFLVAELLHASGVLAVVTCGLLLSQWAPRSVRADTRQQAYSFWSLATFLLNGSLFVLVGLELQSAVRELTSATLATGVVAVAVITGVVFATRFGWLFTAPYVVRLLDRREAQQARRVPARERVVSGLCGFRGAVSLAAALAVPQTLASGGDFPNRDLIVFVVSGVVLVTVTVPGLLLPRVLGWARLPDDSDIEDELAHAHRQLAEAAADAVPQLADELEVADGVVERVRREADNRQRVVAAEGDEEAELRRHLDDYGRLRLALIGRKRAELVRLRDDHEIDDIVLRRIEEELDLEELRLDRRSRHE